MSADDSICILKSPTTDGAFEFRVVHLNSVHWDLLDIQNEFGSLDREWEKVRHLFARAPVFTSEGECEAFVDKLDAELQQSGLPEYGDTHLVLNHVFF